MALRIISILILVVSVFFVSWWLFLILGICGAIFNKYFFEFVGISFVSDILYGIPGRFHITGILTTFIIALVIVLVIEYIKTIIRRKDEIYI
jgi:hypothetical protein